jgi:ATP-binding cassette subfamily B protein
VLLTAVTIALLAIDTTVAVITAISFGASYALIVRLSRKRLKRNSLNIAHQQTKVVKALQEGLGSIRDVLLNGTQSVYCDIYREADYSLRRAQGENAFISGSPRYIMESMGMVLIAVLSYALSQKSSGLAAALPVLGALALGAQRLLPALQQSYSSWSSIAGSQASLADALSLLNQPYPIEITQCPPQRFLFKDSIKFKDVCFRYGPDGPWDLAAINLTIPKGARVGVVGSTGSGKSTAVDLLMGLLLPTEGQLVVDGLSICGARIRQWQASIAHVPQTIYLADSTMAENIAFGVPIDQIDMDRVCYAAKRAQISAFIERNKNQYKARVGEHGVRLSGGQRQRIGIARALYKNVNVLVLDEATSALDHVTEKLVMESIEELSNELTIIHITHRLSTLSNCDMIVKIEKGRIVFEGKYSELVNVEKLNE